MVIVKLAGGLGNQMFRYAAGKALALRHNCPLKVDLSFYEAHADGYGDDDARRFELGVFEEPIAVVTKQDSELVTKYNKRIEYKFYNRARKMLGLKPAFIYSVEKEFLKFDESFLNDTGGLFLVEGDRQNERYFSAFSAVIRQAFEFKKELLDPANITIAAQMAATNSISLHVRRGDYVNHSQNRPLTISYYEQAIELLAKSVHNPHFYLFSDDLQWTKNNLHVVYPHTYVDVNSSQDSYKDMYLMSHCRHNIIANSSFSWWGAWLNKNTDKIVAAPADWLPKRHITASDIVPNSWIIVS